LAKRAGSKPLKDFDYETDYSVDSDGDLKLDRQGHPVPKYEVDSDGRKKKDIKGKPMVKRVKK
jgi:hypothetical protein